MNAPHDLQSERALLLCTMLSPASVASGMALDHGVTAGSFFLPEHAEVWATVMAICDRGENPDSVAVQAELRWTEEQRLAVFGPIMESGALLANVKSYVRTVVELGRARHVIDTARRVATAAASGDLDEASRAADDLLPSQGRRHKTKETRQSDLIDHASRPPDSVLRWPWPALDKLMNGLWPAHLTLLGGVTRHGKSVLADQVAEHVEKQGGSVCLYLTEMQELERDLRFVARRSGLPFARLLRGDLRGEERDHDRYVKAVRELPFEIVKVGGMSAADVARDIRRRRDTLAIVDLLNALPGRETHEIDRNVTTLAAAAQESGTHVIACQHLNRNRYVGVYPPEPTLNDLRGSGQLADLATNVLFVYRRAEKDDQGRETHHPGHEAYLEAAKVKNGLEGRLDLNWIGSRMRFDLPVVPGTVGTVAA